MHITTSRRRIAVAALSMSALVVASGPAFGQSPSTKVAYLTKHLDNPWFIGETNGAKELAATLGMDLTVQDLQFDANLALTAMDTVIAAGTQGIIMVVPEQQIGPAVMEKAAAAGIPLIVVDDPIVDAAGNAAPFVGFESSAVGVQVGEQAAAQYLTTGWDPATTRLASLELQTLDVCMQRTDNAIAAFTAAVPDFPAANVIHVPYDGTLAGATPVMADTMTANPGVTNWILVSCNDDGVLGAIRSLEAGGIAADAATGVGLGAHLACDEWAKGTPTSFDSAVYLLSANHGKAAVQLMHDFLVDGTAIPAKSIIPGPVVTEESHDVLACPAA